MGKSRLHGAGTLSPGPSQNSGRSFQSWSLYRIKKLIFHYVVRTDYYRNLIFVGSCYNLWQSSLNTFIGGTYVTAMMVLVVDGIIEEMEAVDKDKPVHGR